MKTPEKHDDRLDPEVGRRLAAIDRALAGEEVEPELAELATLAEDLAAERPEPEQRWRDEMDRRAGERFGASRLRSVRRALDGLKPRRLLVAAGGFATVLVVAVAVGVSVNDQGGDGFGGDPATPALEAPESESGQAGQSAGGGSGGSQNLERLEDLTPAFPEGGAAGAPDAAAYDARAAEEAPGGPAGGAGGGNVPNRENRKEDRSASLALKTETDEVRDVSDRAIQITESAGGVVLSSQLTEREMESRAVLDLQVPTAQLDGVLDQLTDLATVESLNEGLVDITEPFVSARERLTDARAEREKLLEALGNASTDEEAEALRRQLRQVRNEISRAKADFSNIARRARTSQIALAVTGTPGGGDDGSWSLGDAADDALSVLKAVAGVMLISAAILAPVGLLVAVIVVIARAVRRRSRERALDEE